MTPEERRRILLAMNDIAPGDRAGLMAALRDIARLVRDDPYDGEALAVGHLLWMELTGLDYDARRGAERARTH